MSNSKPTLPAWVHIYEKWYFKLVKMLSSLNELEGPFISDSELQDIGIEVSTLDFMTGSVPQTSTPYFTPSPREEFTVARSGIDPAKDEFTRYRNSVFMLNRLQTTFQTYSSPVFQKSGNDYWGPSDFYATCIKSRRYKSVRAVSGTRAKDRSNGGLPHLMLNLEIDALVDGDRLFVPELVHIVGWMVTAMSHQEAALRRHTTLKAGYLVHMIFPTLLISFLRPACVRVLYAYFDGTVLKVHATKPQDFNVPNYTEMMDALLRWRFATTYWGETLFRKIDDKLLVTELDEGKKVVTPNKPTRRSKVSFAVDS